MAERVLDDIVDYLANPSSPEDRGREFRDLSERAQSLTSELQGVRHLLTTSLARPSAEVLAVLKSVEQFVVDVQVHTTMKHVNNPEVPLMELRACLSRAELQASNDE